MPRIRPVVRDKDDAPMSDTAAMLPSPLEPDQPELASAALEHPALARPRWQRLLFAGLGGVMTVAGIVGLLLPYVPGVLFLILAAACFTRSSPRLETWLLEHPRLGPPVVAWRSNGAIPRKAKLLACAGMMVSFAMLFVLGAPWPAIAGLGAVIAGSCAFVLSRPDA
jgi:uncharacterized protein